MPITSSSSAKQPAALRRTLRRAAPAFRSSTIRLRSPRRPSRSLSDGAPFLLASIHNHPHKNFAGLLLAVRQAGRANRDLKLVVIGYGDEKFAESAAALPEHVRARARHAGYVPRKELDGLYRRARAFITLSRFEGFNMSAAEAASHGTPLIPSDLPLHRELFPATHASSMRWRRPSSPYRTISQTQLMSVSVGRCVRCARPLPSAGPGAASSTRSAPRQASTAVSAATRAAYFLLLPRRAAGVFAYALLSTTMLAGAATLPRQRARPCARVR